MIATHHRHMLVTLETHIPRNAAVAGIGASLPALLITKRDQHVTVMYGNHAAVVRQIWPSARDQRVRCGDDEEDCSQGIPAGLA